MHFISKTLLLTTRQPANKIFSHPHTLFVILKGQKTTKTLGKTSKTNLGPIFVTQHLDPFWLKNTETGPIFDTTAFTNKKIYIYIYIYPIRPICLLHFGPVSKDKHHFLPFVGEMKKIWRAQEKQNLHQMLVQISGGHFTIKLG